MTVTLLEGDCLETLKTLPDCSVQCCVTSPPYFRQRDYNSDKQIGLENTPEEYVNKLVNVFREVYRVLKDDGTFWLNIGDKYNGSGGEHKDGKGQDGLKVKNRGKVGIIEPTQIKELKPKDLIGLPWMVAFALRAEGWYLRSDIIWFKANPQPESVKDRCTKSHEYIFLLTKNAKYYYDADAIAEIATGYDGRKDTMFKGSVKNYNGVMPDGKPQTFAQRGHERWRYKNLQPDGQLLNSFHISRANGEKDKIYPIRNKRDVWKVNTRGFKGAHFAVYPPELIIPCVLAGSKIGDTILDPFNGSGTTGEVAVSLGRNYIGCELNPEYIEITKERLSKIQLVLNPNSIIT